MGGSQSTRRVTVINDTNPDVIKISDDVVHRIKNADPNASSAKTAGSSNAAPVYPSYSELMGQSNRNQQEQLDKLDAEWRERTDELNRQNQQLYKLATDKFTGSVVDVDKEYVGNACTSPVCKNTQGAVLECYRKNGKQPLLCSKEVAAFQNCVHTTRHSIGAN